MAYSLSNTENRKDWQKYIDSLREERVYRPKELKLLTMCQYPDIPESTIYYYITHTRPPKESTNKSIGYSCPKCECKTSAICGLTYHGDSSIREHRCPACNYIWKTIEIDLDMYESLIGR